MNLLCHENVTKECEDVMGLEGDVMALDKRRRIHGIYTTLSKVKLSSPFLSCSAPLHTRLRAKLAAQTAHQCIVILNH